MNNFKTPADEEIPSVTSTDAARHVVIVEDNQADIYLIRESFDQCQFKYELQVFGDGEDALRFVESLGRDKPPPCPDLFIIDLHLPKVDGLEILRKIKAHQSCTQTPVILLTGTASPTERRAIESFPNVFFLMKESSFEDYLKIGLFVQTLLAQVEGKRTPLHN